MTMIRTLLASAALSLAALPAAAEKLSLGEISSYLNSFQAAQGKFTQINEDQTISTVAARTLTRITELGRRLTAIELMVGAQAADLRGITADLGPPMTGLYRAIRALSPQIDTDRPLTNDMESLAKHIREGRLPPPA